MNFPTSIIIRIFILFKFKQLPRYYLLCKRIAQILKSNEFWQMKLRSDFKVVNTDNPRLLYLHLYMEKLLNKCDKINQFDVSVLLDRLQLLSQHRLRTLEHECEIRSLKQKIDKHVKRREKKQIYYCNVRKLTLSILPAFDYRIIRLNISFNLDLSREQIIQLLKSKINAQQITMGNLVLLRCQYKRIITYYVWYYFPGLTQEKQRPMEILAPLDILGYPLLVEFTQKYRITLREATVLFDIENCKLF